MKNIKELYEKDVNIMKFFREYGEEKESNSLEAILYAYDYQAGSYTQEYFSDKILHNEYIKKGIATDLTLGEERRIAAQAIAKELSKLSFDTILEVGIGEATTICDVLNALDAPKDAWGIDISLSRLLFAKSFMNQKKCKINVAVGDMFYLPFEDNSVDVIFTYHCIEANRGKEESAIQEMLRVCKKYLVFVEPSYELGNDVTRKRIDELCYINNLYETLSRLNVNILEHRLFDIFTYNNNSALTIVEKMDDVNEAVEGEGHLGYSCPL